MASACTGAKKGISLVSNAVYWTFYSDGCYPKASVGTPEFVMAPCNQNSVNLMLALILALCDYISCAKKQHAVDHAVP